MCQTEIDISVNDKEGSAMEVNRVGVDLAKNVFQLHGADRRGKPFWKRRLSRAKGRRNKCVPSCLFVDPASALYQ